jgi:hypothetical protein
MKNSKKIRANCHVLLLFFCDTFLGKENRKPIGILREIVKNKIPIFTTKVTRENKSKLL